MKDITGNKFNRLTAIRFTKRVDRSYYWIFRCSCSNKKEIEVTSSSVISGHTKSCGCLQREIMRKIVTTHGMHKTRFYNIWSCMQDRIYNKKRSDYKNYGNRGIKCKWKSFEHFKDDMYESYLKHVENFGERQTSIDRINNNGNYCKENCRWATCKEQSTNRRVTRMIIFRNKNLCLKDWAKELDMNKETLLARVNKLNWSIERALTTPVR